MRDRWQVDNIIILTYDKVSSMVSELRDLNLHCAYEDLRLHVKKTSLKRSRSTQECKLKRHQCITEWSVSLKGSGRGEFSGAMSKVQQMFHCAVE